MAGIFEITNLSDFLTKNVHPDLYPRLFVMSPNGKLVAYSHPYLISDVKAEAVIVAMAWKNHSAKKDHSSQSPLRSLTIETSEYNIMARSIQADLLLVLVGFRGYGADFGYKIRSETAHDESDADPGSRLEQDIVSLTARGHAKSCVEALMLQRRKLDKLANTIGDEAKVFTVADDGRHG